MRPTIILSCLSVLVAPIALAEAPKAVPAIIETEPGLQDDGNDVAFWIHPTDPALSLLLASGGTAGLELFSLEGKRVGRYADSEIDFLAVSPGFSLGGDTVQLVVGYDRRSGGLQAFTVDPATRTVRNVSTATFDTHGEVTGLCGYRSAETGRAYVFVAVEGTLQQWSFAATGPARDRVAATLVRTLPVGMGAGYCATDEASGSVFVSEETVGIWRFDAESETEAVRTPVDLVAPRGGIEEEVKGLAVYRADADRAWLIAADVAAGRFNVYTVPDGKPVGSFTIAGAGGVDGVTESEGLTVTTASLAGADGGWIATFDEDNEGGAGNVKLVKWGALASALNLAVAANANVLAPIEVKVSSVMPVLETPPLPSYGDAADDPAIWVNRADPEKSAVIATDKKRGLVVYDLDGQILQRLDDGRMNNVDVREGFRFQGRDAVIVTASDRTNKSLAIYELDPATRQLRAVHDGVIATGLSPYGLCMYKSAKTGDVYVFINDEDGLHRQWRLKAQGDKVRAIHVRDIPVETQAEGCVADDETGALYIAEEDVGLWRYSAEPKAGLARRQVDRMKEAGGNLTADAEGVSIWAGEGGKGYLVLSNQGADNYAVYKREAPNEFVGFFSIVANEAAGIDGVSETDGLDVVSAPLGARYPQGLLVTQDGRNITPFARQNFKFVSWADVAAALGLPPP